MKYILLLILIVLITRIDFWLDLTGRTINKIFPSESVPVISESLTNNDTVPLKEDMFAQSNSKEIFFSLLENFHGDPSADIRVQAIKVLKENPHIIKYPFDKELEAHVYKWRDLLSMNHKEIPLFIFDMMKILRDENKELLKRFLSLGIEINLRDFISSNYLGPDVNCSTIIAFGDPYSEDEKINLLFQRQKALNEFLGMESIDLSQKKFAKSCLVQLQIQLNKMSSKLIETGQPPQEESQSSLESISTGVSP
jgi:hypothetical protein